MLCIKRNICRSTISVAHEVDRWPKIREEKKRKSIKFASYPHNGLCLILGVTFYAWQAEFDSLWDQTSLIFLCLYQLEPNLLHNCINWPSCFMWTKAKSSVATKFSLRWGLGLSFGKAWHIVQIRSLGYKKNCRRNPRLPWEHPCKELRNKPPRDIAGP